MPPGGIRAGQLRRAGPGTIVQLELHDLEDPLVYLHGTYRSSSTIAGEGRHRRASSLRITGSW
jgi:hypothetical protein